MKTLKINLKHVERWEKTDVAELPVKEAIVNVLKRNGVKTMGDIVSNWRRLNENKLKDIGVNKGKTIRVAFIEWYGSTLRPAEQIDFLCDVYDLNKGGAK